VIVDAEGVRVLTLAIINIIGPTELGVWDIKSKNGTRMTRRKPNFLGELHMY